ncbi:coiled-coil domain-containing protein 157-like [Nyctibius grandis]|uniref:coiled-coil domain-containing protein 157-like n=1 Tax=Nyctibius grandis TaxID=48427 RepID=UPI0035BBFFFF
MLMKNGCKEKGKATCNVFSRDLECRREGWGARRGPHPGGRWLRRRQGLHGAGPHGAPLGAPGSASPPEPLPEREEPEADAADTAAGNMATARHVLRMRGGTAGAGGGLRSGRGGGTDGRCGRAHARWAVPHTNSCLQEISEKKAGTKEMPTLPSTPQARKPKKQHPKHRLPDVLDLRASTEVAKSPPLCPSPSARAPDSDTSGSSLPRAACSTAESSRSIATRAAGSSLGPCDTCTCAQAGLRDIGKAMTSICHSQNIPSALSKFQERVEETTGTMTLSATDVSYRASEQSKDLSRISKQLQMLLQQVKPLKAELEESQKQKEELRKQVEDFSRLLQAQKEARAQQREEAERNLHVKNKEHLEAVARLQRDKNDLQRRAALLEERFCALKEELAAKQAAVQELGKDPQGSPSSHFSPPTPLRSHGQSLQAKQRALLQHLNGLDQEREEVQASLGAAEEDKARLAEQLEESRERSGQQLQAQQELLDTLRREKLSLQQSVSELQANVSRLQEQARELKERERLLVLFPELPGSAGRRVLFAGTGSLTEEMEKQLQANSIRTSVLEEQNTRLGSALAKLKATAEQGMQRHEDD